MFCKGQPIIDALVHLRYGSLEDQIYPPPTQPITDGFIAANDIWDQWLCQNPTRDRGGKSSHRCGTVEYLGIGALLNLIHLNSFSYNASQYISNHLKMFQCISIHDINRTYKYALCRFLIWRKHVAAWLNMMNPFQLAPSGNPFVPRWRGGIRPILLWDKMWIFR